MDGPDWTALTGDVSLPMFPGCMVSDVDQKDFFGTILTISTALHGIQILVIKISSSAQPLTFFSAVLAISTYSIFRAVLASSIQFWQIQPCN